MQKFKTGTVSQALYALGRVRGWSLVRAVIVLLTYQSKKAPNSTLEMAAAAGEGVVDESRYIEEGALYLVEERLETFKESHWPFDSGPCTALKVRQGCLQSVDWTGGLDCGLDYWTDRFSMHI